MGTLDNGLLTTPNTDMAVSAWITRHPFPSALMSLLTFSSGETLISLTTNTMDSMILLTGF